MVYYMIIIFGEKFCLDYVGENESCFFFLEILKKKIIVKVLKCVIDIILFMFYIWYFGLEYKVWKEKFVEIVS